VAVRINVTPPESTAAYGVEERFSGNAVATEVSDSGLVDSAGQVIRWGPFFDQEPRALSYKLSVQGSGAPVIGFEGKASFDGSSVAIGGTQQLPVGVLISGVAISPAGELQFSLGAADGQTYTIEVSTDLRTWSVLTTVIITSGQLRFTDTSRSQHKFYRVTSP
jgi:hypothetical protein